MYLFPAIFGLPDGVTAIKISFVMVAVWWLVFSYPLAKNVPEPHVEVSPHNVETDIAKYRHFEKNFAIFAA